MAIKMMRSSSRVDLMTKLYYHTFVMGMNRIS